MEILLIIILSVLLSVLIGKWGSSWGRSFGGWFVCSLFLSPVIAAIILLLVGKSETATTSGDTTNSKHYSNKTWVCPKCGVSNSYNRTACRKCNEPQPIELHTGECCQSCGKIYETVYKLPDDIWARITPSMDKEAGLLCISCADKIAIEKRISLCWGGKENEFPRMG